MIQPYSFTVINEQYVKAACDFMSQAALIYPPLLQRQFYRIRGLLRRFMPAELVTQLIQPRGFLLELVLLRPGFPSPCQAARAVWQSFVLSQNIRQVSDFKITAQLSR